MGTKNTLDKLVLVAGQRVKERKYWLNKLAGELGKCYFPYDFSHRPAENKSDAVEPAKNVKFRFPGSLYEKALKLSGGTDVKLHMILVTGLFILLHKYTNNSDIMIGSPILKQENESEFINTVLVFRNEIATRMSFKELLLEVRKTIIEAAENQNYPLEVLLEDINMPLQENEGFPLFDTVLLFENLHDKKYLQGINYNMMFSFSRTDEGIEGLVEYNSLLYRDSAIEQIAAHYLYILEQALTGIDLPLYSLELLSEQEKQQLLCDFNNMEAGYPQDKLLHHLFEEQAARTPGNIAVVGESVELNVFRPLVYREFNTRADLLAQALHQKGVGPDTIVGLLIEPSIEMMIGILGILKSGAAYLPIDPAFPQERIDYILKDSSAKIVLTANEIASLSMQCVADSHRLSSIGHHAKQLAYLIYTSGTTGKSKGVMLEHGNVVAYVHAFLEQFHIDSTDTVIQLASYCFDVFVEEVFPVLSRGGKLVIPGRAEIVEINKLLQLMTTYHVTIIDCTPLLLNEFNKINTGTGCAALASVHTFISGGDVLKPAYVADLLKKGSVYNTYGPTESTVCATYYHYTGAAGDLNSIPIGKPISNYKVHILDEHRKLVPIGVAGEIYISGPGVARGYLNRPELTAEKFDKFNYKTGDLARWLSDGNIEYLGRVDFQVKIRGFRIECGEIEAQLLKHDAIKEAIVLDREGENGEKYLCAYIAADRSLDLTALREYLLSRLPDYMIPAYFIPVDRIPFTDRGKVDRKGLQSYITTLSAAVEFVPPKSELEQRIAESWQEVLKLEKVSIYDNFFERGGNSLSIIQLTNRLNNILEKELPVVTLFQYPTIDALARHLEENNTKINLAPAVKEVKLTNDTADLPVALKENMDIAVIGMAGRFPGAADIDEFWHNLQAGREGITFFTDEELLEAGVAQELIHNPNYVKACGILADKDKFDAAFFDYIPAEAKIMDPQIRLFHECAWEAFENAGYIAENYTGPIGVYAGASNSFEWAGKVLFSEEGRTTESFEVAQLVDKDFLATRISYKLNLKGPSISLKSACSTSLVAVHMACRALINRECDMTAAGGVTLLSTGKSGYLYQDGMIMSPDGHCRSFDARAAGTVGGEGAGIVILKRLKEAEADRDNIYAVVKCSVVNNDGINKVGYTAPGVEGQREVIAKALSLAGVAPESISYVETHGTGTVLGDPIEIKALTLAFATEKRKYCAIGSVKSNVGHLDSAAGVTGFIKTVLALYHRQIPASLHFEKPNPAIDFENSPFYVNTQLKPWKNNGYPLRACVNAFGIGGTNAHIVLEEFPGIEKNYEENENRVERNYQLILLSAKTSPALTAMRERLAGYFKENPLLNPADAAYTLQVGRKAFKHRAALVISSLEEAADKLQSTDKMQFYILTEENRNIVFMFPGQGAQYVNMAKDLYENEPIFRREMDQCFEILTPMMGYDIKKILYPLDKGEENDKEKKEIDQTEVSQPVIFIIEYALAKMLMAWGINPGAMIGHSLGEYTAACLSGVFSLPDALQIICLRGKLMQQMPGGAMLGIPLAEKELIPLLEGADNISLAAVNSSSHCVVSGTYDAVEAFEKQLEKKGYPVRRLHTSHAFHSDMMDPILEEFAREVGRVTLHKPHIPFLSNVTGTWITMNDAVDPRYWTRHLRQTVRFRDGITQLLNNPPGQTIFIEAGPGKVLSTFVIQHADRKNNMHQVVNLVKRPQEDIADDNYLLEKIGQLWLYGITPDWHAFHPGEKRRRTPLPNYPFQRRPFRLEGTLSPLAAGMMARPQFEKRGDITEWFYTPVWEQSVSPVTPDTPQGAHWLVFVDECGLGLTFCKRLEQQGDAVIMVKAGADFEKTGDREFVINPQKEDHYHRIFVEFPELKKIHFKILHFWGITGDNVAGLEGTDRFLQMGFYSLLYMARALGEHGIDRVDMEVITANMHCVTGEEELYPVKSSVVGAIRTIPMEYQGIRCRNIDIVLPAPGSPGESRLLARLLEKINTVFTEQDAIVALRGEFSWIPVIKPVRLEKTGAALPPLIKENG
ncbi:MAG TPA: amino acid adenylation domain-containing protein, partial [Candidatus Deferrimicrobium sp.]|nr:amino acid adenylation domain-containing protein [Candidatus Deferrimicrobium sp.]